MRERILSISKSEGLSHIGSNLGMAEVMAEIYRVKRDEDIVVLDGGHAHLAHLVAREKYEGENIEGLIRHDIHCNYEAGCDVATGSLGLGILVALGMAIADRDRDVYCALTDGGCAEGSVWEALRIKSGLNVDNLKCYVSANGWGALGEIDVDLLERRLKEFDPTIVVMRTKTDFEGNEGLKAHYGKI